jgi:hypothetical protein
VLRPPTPSRFEPPAPAPGGLTGEAEPHLFAPDAPDGRGTGPDAEPDAAPAARPPASLAPRAEPADEPLMPAVPRAVDLDTVLGWTTPAEADGPSGPPSESQAMVPRFAVGERGRPSDLATRQAAAEDEARALPAEPARRGIWSDEMAVELPQPGPRRAPVPAAAPVPPPAAHRVHSEFSPEGPSAPTVVVHIGRVDVRAVHPPAPPAAPRANTSTGTSLEEHLRARDRSHR